MGDILGEHLGVVELGGGLPPVLTVVGSEQFVLVGNCSLVQGLFLVLDLLVGLLAVEGGGVLDLHFGALLG